jgi:DNA-binding NtrC family response regulator
MKSDMNDLKKLVYSLIRNGDFEGPVDEADSKAIRNLIREAKTEGHSQGVPDDNTVDFQQRPLRNNIQDTEEILEESLSLADKEVEMITKALEKYKGKRKLAAQELGISERTLYRKIKEYGLEN